MKIVTLALLLTLTLRAQYPTTPGSDGQVVDTRNASNITGGTLTGIPYNLTGGTGTFSSVGAAHSLPFASGATLPATCYQATEFFIPSGTGLLNKCGASNAWAQAYTVFGVGLQGGGDIAGGTYSAPQVTGVNGTSISTTSSVIQRLDGAGHFRSAVYYVDGLLVVPTPSPAVYSQSLLASGNGGFYLAETFLDVATAATGTCSAIPYLSYTNEAGLAVTQAMTATAFNFSSTSSSMGYSQPIENGTTASVSISVTPSSTCSGGTFNMHSRLLAQ